MVGAEDLLEKIASGKFNFSKLICTPSMMSKIGKLGKSLGTERFNAKSETWHSY